MSFKEEIVKFLSQPANLELALQIGDYLQDVKEHVEREFWRQVHEFLQHKINDHENEKTIQGWTVSIPEGREREIGRDYPGVSILPVQPSKKKKNLYVTLCKEGYRLLIGIAVSNLSEDGSLSDIQGHIHKLQQELLSKGYKIQDKWWVGWKWMDKGRLTDNANLLQMARGNAYANEMGSQVWDLFQTFKKDLEKINDELLKN